MQTYHLLINGRLEEGAASMDVVNPATEQVFAASPRASAEQLDEAVAAAQAAFAGWSATPIAQRQAVLTAIADAIEANAHDLARLLTREQGKPIPDAEDEIAGAASFFRYFATLDLPVHKLEAEDGNTIEVHRRPLGVVACILPWNFPVVLLACKVPPALLAGNTVIVKPAPTTPLTTLRLGEIIKDLVPPGVVNIIADANDLGGALSAHPGVRKVSFTGSTVTGKKVMASAADTLKRITLELGGNDAAIVLADADLNDAVPKLFQSAFFNAGQVCFAVKRLYVQEPIYDQVCNELASFAEQITVGDGSASGTEIGPLQNKAQFEKVMGILQDAMSRGRVIAGGAAQRPGYFVKPTIVRDISEGARVVDEEQFGPILPVIKFTDPEDAVARANASPYGLGGSVWSADVERARELAARLSCGTAWVNTHGDVRPDIPFGGAGQSGIGVELSEDGLAEFTQLHIVNIATPAPRQQPKLTFTVS